jgi:hypothetical protein
MLQALYQLTVGMHFHLFLYLDDSENLDAFDETDQKWLERVVALLHIE